ncbi:hypothetical protein GCM10023350_03560 [Nocardioides endophyticus]|uniref:Uncharacterized protein n=1 Tax=Nocardioides endophyticus TaxID=1353775 RepID=A0ABP8YAC8_9ACTN
MDSGVGGFRLQGGQGWNARGWGWAAEYVVAVDVVTAEGQLVRYSVTENSDLYWASRDSGPGSPGVVTRFHLQTRPLPRHFAHTVQGFRLDNELTTPEAERARQLEDNPEGHRWAVDTA